MLIGILLGRFAWFMANTDLKKMAEGTMDPGGRDQTRIGKLCGVIACVILIPQVVLLLVRWVPS